MVRAPSLRMIRMVLVAAVLVTAVLVPVTPGAGAGSEGVVAPDGSRSLLTQNVVDREPLAGGGWRVTIEATLDSNTICHTLLFQCVVEPELNPTDLTLESVQCLSPGWNQIQITLPVVGTVVDVCARFDHHRAGHDQRFRFVYTTPVNVGSLQETAKFFRFPEEFFFIRAQHTVTIDLSAQVDVHTECPDTAAIGTSISCTVRMEAFSNIPTAGAAVLPPAQLTNLALAPDADPANWDCSALTSCSYTAGGGTLPIGTYTFTTPADVVGPADRVDVCGAAVSGGVDQVSDCAEVQVYEDDTATTVDIDKTTTVTEVDPGGALTYTITLTNTGTNPATDLRVFETPPPLLGNAAIRYLSGDGTWACTSGATLECTAATLAPGGVTTFEVTGTVSTSAAPGAPIVNEITAEIANDPFGPDFPSRSGALVTVRGASTAATPVAAAPTFTG